MNTLQFLLVAACLAVLAALVALVLPSSWEVARDVQVHGTVPDCHEQVGDLETWERWFPWGGGGPGRIQTGPKTWGEGAALSWTDSEVGPGSLTVLSEDGSDGLTFEVILRGGRERVRGRIEYTELSNLSSRVLLTLHGEVESSDLIGRYLALKRAYTVGPDLVDALAALREQIETRP